MAGLAGTGLGRNHQGDKNFCFRMLDGSFDGRKLLTGCWIIYGWNLRSDMVQKLKTGVPKLCPRKAQILTIFSNEKGAVD